MLQGAAVEGMEGTEAAATREEGPREEAWTAEGVVAAG